MAIYLFNLSVAGLHQIHMQPLYMKPLPENTKVLTFTEALCCCPNAHISHTSLLEEGLQPWCRNAHTQKNLKSYYMLKHKRLFNMLVHTTQLVNDEHNSFTGFVSQTHLLP